MCPVEHGLLMFTADPDVTEGFARLEGVGEFILKWEAGPSGAMVYCSSVRQRSNAIYVQGHVKRLSGEPAVGAGVMICDQQTFTDIHGEFYGQVHWPRGTSECDVWAQYQNRGAFARGPAQRITASMGGDVVELQLTVPDMPDWAPHKGETFDEACAEQRRNLEGAQSGSISIPEGPEFPITMAMRIKSMPPCATDGLSLDLHTIVEDTGQPL